MYYADWNGPFLLMRLWIVMSTVAFKLQDSSLCMIVWMQFISLFQLKGCPWSKVKAEVDRMISVLHLEDKRHTAAKDLSSGMKRKLCVGIALIAGSKVYCHSINLWTKLRGNRYAGCSLGRKSTTLLRTHWPMMNSTTLRLLWCFIQKAGLWQYKIY